jgi:hypothetical protein
LSPLIQTISSASARGLRGFGSKPNAPTITSVTVNSSTQVTIAYTLGSNNGAPITSIFISSSPSISLTYTNTDLDGSIVVTGTFVQNQAYTFTMTATNAFGTSDSSSASESKTPNAIPVVSGGTLFSDATYYYRRFTGNGNLSVSNTSLNADVLTVAGGGSGGGSDTGQFGSVWFMGGGGGAGGLLY